MTHKLLLVAALFLAAEDAPLPQLTTAERIAIQTCERTKADAQKQYNDADQQELTIEREWQAAHPGFHIDRQTFLVVADPPAPKPAPKK